MLIRMLFTCLLSVVLGACGGSSDGSDDNSGELVTITTDNAVEIAASVTSSTIDNDTTLDSADLFSDLLVLQPPSAKVGFEYSDLMKTVLAQAPTGGVGNTPFNFSVNCASSGSFSVSATLANPEMLSQGDSITITFDACSDGEETQDGSIVLSITAFSGDTGAEYSLAFSVEYNNLSFTEEGETSRISGDVSMSITFSEGVITTEFSSNAFSVVEDGREQTVTDYAITTAVNAEDQSISLSVSGSLSSDELGGTVSFATIEPFTASATDDDPVSGVLRITGADGATLTITVQDTVNVLLEIDSDGDGQVDQTIETTWQALDEFFDE